MKRFLVRLMRKPNYSDWLRKDVWTLDEFAPLACGFDPEISEEEFQAVFTTDPDDTYLLDKYAPCRRISDLARRSICAGNISVLNGEKILKDAAIPKVWIEWAASKGIALPPELLEEQERINSNFRQKTTSRHWENEHYDVITRCYEGLKEAGENEPSNKDVWEKLMNTDYDTEEIIVVEDEYMRWSDRKGGEHVLQRRSFNNFMTKLRKQKS